MAEISIELPRLENFLEKLYGHSLRTFLDRITENLKQGVKAYPAAWEERPRPSLFLGPPGIGKTETIERFSEDVVRSWCVEKGGSWEGVKLSNGLVVPACVVDGRPIFVVKIPGTPIEAVKEVVKRVESGSAGAYVIGVIPATHIFPEDLGIPRRIEGIDAIEMLPPILFKLMSTPNTAGVLFVDEITNLERDDQKAMWYAILQEGRIGVAAQMSPAIAIVTAGNRPEHSSLARELPFPLINRLLVFEVSPPYSLDQVVQYLEKRFRNILIPEVLEFAKAAAKALEQNLHQTYASKVGETLRNFLTPRSFVNMVLAINNVLRASDEVLRKIAEVVLRSIKDLPEDDKAYVLNRLHDILEYLRMVKLEGRPPAELDPRIARVVAELEKSIDARELQKVYDIFDDLVAIVVASIGPVTQESQERLRALIGELISNYMKSSITRILLELVANRPETYPDIVASSEALIERVFATFTPALRRFHEELKKQGYDTSDEKCVELEEPRCVDALIDLVLDDKIYKVFEEAFAKTQILSGVSALDLFKKILSAFSATLQLAKESGALDKEFVVANIRPLVKISREAVDRTGDAGALVWTVALLYVMPREAARTVLKLLMPEASEEELDKVLEEFGDAYRLKGIKDLIKRISERAEEVVERSRRKISTSLTEADVARSGESRAKRGGARPGARSEEESESMFLTS